MKKVGILLLCTFLLTGCLYSNKTKEREHNEKYENYMELLIDNSKQVTMNLPFRWKFNMYENGDEYGYDVAIEKPTIAMYNIQMVAVDISEISENKIAPNIGLFEDQTYNMIPNQINAEKGFYEGVGVQGFTNKSEFILNCLVVYKDKNQVDNYAYFIINANIKDFQSSEEVNKDE